LLLTFSANYSVEAFSLSNNRSNNSNANTKGRRRIKEVSASESLDFGKENCEHAVGRGDNNDNDNESDDHHDVTTYGGNKSTRRDVMLSAATTLTSLVLLPASPKQAQAACLAGDTSPDCIGCYKVPIDEAINSMVSTPEQLAKYAPDLRWSPPIEYPKNYNVAKDEIVQLKPDVNQLSSYVTKGDLTKAGVEILRIVPRITVAGRVLISTLEGRNEYTMKALRVEAAHSDLLASLGSADVLIGQSFAGQLGSITAAQIQILQDLRSANEYYDDLLKALPKEFSV